MLVSEFMKVRDIIER